MFKLTHNEMLAIAYVRFGTDSLNHVNLRRRYLIF